jgi:hypothetical protein
MNWRRNPMRRAAFFVCRAPYVVAVVGCWLCCAGNCSAAAFPEESEGRDIITHVQETPTGSVLFGLGVNSDAGLIGVVVLNERNFDILRPPTSWDDIFDYKEFRGSQVRPPSPKAQAAIMAMFVLTSCDIMQGIVQAALVWESDKRVEPRDMMGHVQETPMGNLFCRYFYNRDAVLIHRDAEHTQLFSFWVSLFR